MKSTMTSETDSIETMLLFSNDDIIANVLEFLSNPERLALTSSYRELLTFRKTKFLSYHFKVSEYLSIKDDHQSRFGEALIHLKNDNSNIEDVSSLGNVYSLHFKLCKNIKDVSALENLHTLVLHDCNEVQDVSALRNVFTLDLSSCWNLQNVSAVGNVHALNLNGCKQIKDVSALGNVHTLHVCLCNEIHVSALRNVQQFFSYI